MRRLGSKITAAATTGPKSDPRPASSSPAILCQPHLRASRSNRDEHCLSIAANFNTDNRSNVHNLKKKIQTLNQFVLHQAAQKQKARKKISGPSKLNCNAINYPTIFLPAV
jgi:hypothetical protein